ncbi:MAG: SH3 domain-containing protein [Clostridia bacterium]|nr:SH3 domain-containing protein [Clostridia bacterium]MBQ8554437.1 SH3 domain-containing protein [Clostridia bacterium]MBQ8557149.1 SH3 domain-containing protein [Clostridia bacterium]
MSRILMDTFLRSVDAIADERPEYQLGHDGSDGKCDCIGLIIGAIRRSGGSWDGIHGSNYAARNEMDYLLPATDPDDLNVGEVVYKAAMPGQTNYNLPDRYDKDPDKRDYFHIGVVRSVDPLRIVHCTGPGIVVDTKLGKWNYRGWLRKVSQEGEETVSEIRTATVAAMEGSTVNLRQTPGGALLDRVPVGVTVTVAAQQDGWSRVHHDGLTGWMMSRFLQMEGEPAAADKPAGDMVTVTMPREMAEQLRDLLADGVGWG